MTILQPIFRVRVVYKSGYTHDFECLSFTIRGGTYEWKHANDANKPVLLGVDEIAAVWQVGMRYRLALQFRKQA